MFSPCAPALVFRCKEDEDWKEVGEKGPEVPDAEACCERFASRCFKLSIGEDMVGRSLTV